MDPIPASAPPGHRTVCVRLREVCIQQARFIQDMMLPAHPQQGPFYRDLIASITQTIRLIEKDAGLRAWDGA